MTLLLLFRLAVLAAETAFTGIELLYQCTHCNIVCSGQADLFACGSAAYGTYVVFGTDIKCKVGDEVIWNPKKEVKVLVCLTWGFQLLSL